MIGCSSIPTMFPCLCPTLDNQPPITETQRASETNSVTHATCMFFTVYILKTCHYWLTTTAPHSACNSGELL